MTSPTTDYEAGVRDEPAPLPPDADEICMCGDRIGSGGWTCRHGGCRSMADYYREQDERGEHEEARDG